MAIKRQLDSAITRLDWSNLYGPELVESTPRTVTIRFDSAHDPRRVKQLELELDDHAIRELAEILHKYIKYRQDEIDKTRNALVSGAR